MDNQDFPYSFDLWFDIKSREDLVSRYAELKRELSQMDMIMSGHGMEFTEEEMAVISPEPEPETASGPKPF